MKSCWASTSGGRWTTSPLPSSSSSKLISTNTIPGIYQGQVGMATKRDTSSAGGGGSTGTASGPTG
ncbi:unnamed protein product [Linum tenue]|nr:unnamed protein product [Linum tenue]